MRAQITTRDYENISAYLDGQLSSREVIHFEQHLRERPLLKAALDDMRRTRALLRTSPHRRAPRSFALTPAMVAQKQTNRSWSFNLFPVYRFASALAILLLIATFAFDQMPGVSSTADMARSAPQEAVQSAMATQPAGGSGMKSAPEIAAMPEAQGPAPSIIQWGMPAGAQPYNEFLGKGGGPSTELLGQGGGGSPDDMGGGVSGGPLIVPLEGVESLRESPALMQDTSGQNLAPEQNFENIPMLEGSGPILGLPQADQAGEYNSPIATPLPARELLQESQNVTTANDWFASMSPIKLAQVILALIALVTGAAAFIVWRRTR